jgi:hypothetical protein
MKSKKISNKNNKFDTKNLIIYIIIIIIILLVFLLIRSFIGAFTNNTHNTDNTDNDKELSFVIVTGASQNHLKSLTNFISSFINIYGNNSNIKLIVYDLDVKQDSWKNLQNKFISYSNIVWKKFDYSKYPEYFNINVKAGEYAWKPVIISDTCKEYGGFVIWMDSGNLIKEKLNSLIKHVEKNGIYSSVSSYDIYKFTHQKTLQYMKCDSSLYTLTNRNAACIGFNYNINWVKQFVNEFTQLAQIKECIAPEGSSRENHRQDQAVFTVLFYQYSKKYNFDTSLYDHIGYTIHNDVD